MLAAGWQLSLLKLQRTPLVMLGATQCSTGRPSYLMSHVAVKLVWWGVVGWFRLPPPSRHVRCSVAVIHSGFTCVHGCGHITGIPYIAERGVIACSWNYTPER